MNSFSSKNAIRSQSTEGDTRTCKLKLDREAGRLDSKLSSYLELGFIIAFAFTVLTGDETPFKAQVCRMQPASEVPCPARGDKQEAKPYPHQHSSSQRCVFLFYQGKDFSVCRQENRNGPSVPGRCTQEIHYQQNGKFSEMISKQLDLDHWNQKYLPEQTWG